MDDASFSKTGGEAGGEARASGIGHGADVGRVGGRTDRIRLRRSPTAANLTTSGDDAANMTYGGGIVVDDGLPACYDAVLMTVSMDFDNPPSGVVNGGA